MSKKTRGPNFSSDEKQVLTHLVTKYKDVVENKKTDAITTACKNEGWKKLTEEFNSISSFCIRNTEQLKTCWDNIKRNARKRKAASKKEIFLTGGGRPDIPPSEPLQGQVEALLGPSLDGLDNPYDSDVQFSSPIIHDIEIIELTQKEGENAAGSSQMSENTAEPKDNNIAGPSQLLEQNEENIPPKATEKQMWSSWTPMSLKTKVSNTLSIERKKPTWLHRRRPKLSSQDEVLQSKNELIQILKQNAQKEASMMEHILQEQLEQEKIKTELLRLELNNKRAE